MIVILKHLIMKDFFHFPEALSLKDGKRVVDYGRLTPLGLLYQKYHELSGLNKKNLFLTVLNREEKD